ncbi:MAG: 4Fe-4S dicluster domain-containing protein [Candidatus Hodarchaeales archaeon]|jgi:molybdopterin-containing oxidoreductase family iron-sulfur binding subunit
MKTNRRNFLKKGVIGLGAAILAAGTITRGRNANLLSLSNNESNANNKIKIEVEDDPERHWGFIIDISKCNACEDQPIPEDDPTGERQQCSYACRTSHFFLKAKPPQYWIRVYELEETPGIPAINFPKPCQNCQNPPCKRVCPTGATYQRKDGTVLINHEICIGCRICMAACPYETRFFWYHKPEVETTDAGYAGNYEYSPEYPVPHVHGTVAKCDYCIHKVYKNQLPHCVSACPTGALYYGDLNEDAVSNGNEVIPFHQTVIERGGYRYKEGEGTNPSVYYLPAESPSPNTNQEKLTTSLTVETIYQKDEKSPIKVKVYAKAANRFPASSAKIVIKNYTTFGSVIVAEGITDSNGYLSCSINSQTNKEMKLKIELVETDQYARSEVVKNV